MTTFRLFGWNGRASKVRPAGRSGFRARLALESLERREVLDASQLWAIAGGSYNLAETFQLHSNPSANHTIYLDFDGHTTGNVQGSGWDNLTSPAWDLSGNGASFTDAERQVIQKVWARVSEDFAPFNVDVTTQQPANLEDLRKSGTGDTKWGIRVVITPDDTPAPGSGGVAYIGSFNYSNFTPVYVFNTSEKSVAEASTHEVGHSLGLGHDGTSTLGYYSGHGSGVTSWGPIMGAAYNPNLTQWSKGEYTGANNFQDDLAIITGGNGFTYKADDFGNTAGTAATLLPQGAGSVSAFYGVIERNTDSDFLTFYGDAGPIALNVVPLTLGPNLALEADLYDAAGNLLFTSNPASNVNAPVNFSLPASGQYFLAVSGTGKGSVSGTGFSNYGSLGNYRISGTVQPYTGGSSNRPPVAANDSAPTAAGTPVTVNVLANDSDPDGDPLSITSVSNFVGGTATISNGQIIFTPTAGFSGTGSFTYAISDGRGGTASASASITVNPPANRPPVAANDSASTAAGTPVTVNVLANDSDPDGDPLSITSVSNFVGGTATISNGQIIFTPTAGFSGTGSFTYAISDGRGGTASASASIVVTPPSSQYQFSNNTDVTITSARPVTVNSTIVVSGVTGTIQDLNLTLNVFHTYDSDLRITLFAPDGTSVRLFNRHGGSANNILGTTFDDAASTSIANGSAPFTGTFRPYALLSAFNGKSANGTWRLQIEDLASQDGGRLDNWTLKFTTGSAPAPAAADRSSGRSLATSLLQIFGVADRQSNDSDSSVTGPQAGTGGPGTPGNLALPSSLLGLDSPSLRDFATALLQLRRRFSDPTTLDDHAGPESDLPRG